MTVVGLQNRCVFPPLHPDKTDSEGWESLEIPRKVADGIFQESLKALKEPYSVLATLWATILTKYVELKAPVIWLVDESLTGFDTPGLITASGPLTEMRAPFRPLNWSTTSAAHKEYPANTGIVVVRAVGQPPDDLDLARATRDRLSKQCDIVLAYQSSHSQETRRLVLHYRTTTLLRLHATSIAEQLEKLMQSVTTQGLQQCTVTAIVDRDRRQINRWNSTTYCETDQAMHSFIHQQALQHPSTCAIDAWDGTLTYEQLDSLSSQLAIRLGTHGVRPSVFVAICFTKTRWSIVAMLAINKTGAAFVPIDPSTPVRRTRTIVRSVDARLVLACDHSVRSLQEASFDIPIMTVSELMEGAPETNGYHTGLTDAVSLFSTPPSTAPAYCLFTSGSTGEPKGCVVTHAAFSGIVHHAGPLDLRPGSRVLQFAALSFGIALIEIWCTLAGAGATVCIPSEDERLNGLPTALRVRDVNWAIMTPTTLELLSPTEAPSLQTIIVAGEPITQSQVSQWATSVRLFQAYGLTEWAGIFSVSPRILSVDPSERNLGWPINGRCWLVDPQDPDSLQPIGAVGELLIAGPNLARGYLHDEDQRVFIKSPAWLQDSQMPPGTSLYRTGDLGRYNPDGTISHMGRKDYQVKIRGQRVETTELEFHLRRLFLESRDVVSDVVLPTGSNGIPSLAAFIVIEPDQQQGQQESDKASASRASCLAIPNLAFFQKAELAKRSLSQILPSYMIPTIFIPLHELPRTVTGKKDRRRLREEVAGLNWIEWKRYTTRAPNGESDAASSKTAPTMTESERILARVWARIFRLSPEEIKPDDDFQALGGDSVTAMKAVALSHAAGLSLTVSDIFAAPRLADVARNATLLTSPGLPVEKPRDEVQPTVGVTDEVQQRCVSALRALQPPVMGETDASPLVLPATEMQSWFIERAGVDSFCFFLRGTVDHVRLQDACRRVVQAHSVLRTVFTKDIDGIFQIVLSTIEPTLYRMTTTMAAADLEEICNTICQSSPAETLHLDRIVVQFILVSAADDDNRHALIIRLSHCQHDGFSIPILFEDLAAAYEGARLSPRSHFVDYCRLRSQRGVAAGYGFWRNYLDGASMTYLGNRQGSLLSQQYCPGTVDAVEASVVLDFFPVPPPGITLATVVKAAWALVLGETTGNTDLVFCQTVNGRSGMSFAGIETVLGPCLNFTPIRIHVEQSRTGREFLRHVQEQHLQTTAFDYLDFSGIVNKSTPWGPITRLGCIFQHQNVAHQIHIPFKSIENDKAVSYLQQEIRSETFVFSIPHPSHLELQIRSGTCSMDANMAKALVEKLALAVRALSDKPDMSVARLMQACRVN
ncbi:hypothetical protein CNMCM8980_001764 [Aspergillus fumigatiaffinis]|nr:hypothetical protein CNMCM8980_001764 [Aspergillus fumigatiaffinis]